MKEEQNDQARREFVKKAVYVAPAIVTLAIAPSYAKAGSEKSDASRPSNRPPSSDLTSWWAWLLKLLGLA